MFSQESTVTFTSEPSKLKCIVFNESNNTVAEGTTPFTTTLENSEIVLQVKCENGMQREVVTQFNPWSFGSLILGVVGLGIDAISGNLTSYYDTNITTLDTAFIERNNANTKTNNTLREKSTP